MDVSHQIMQHLWERLSPVHPARGWERFPAANVVRQCEFVPPRLYAELNKSYSVRDLIAAGVVVRSGDGKVKLSSHLTSHGAPLLALRKTADRPPHELLGPSGSLRGSTAPLVAALADYRIREALADTDTLVIAGTVHDAAQLLAVGIAAVPMSAVEALTAELINCWNELLHHDRPERFEPRAHRRPRKTAFTMEVPSADGSSEMDAPSVMGIYRQRNDDDARHQYWVENVVFAGGSLVDLAPGTPDRMSEVMAQVRQLQTLGEVDPYGFAYWEPDSVFFETLGSRLRLGDVYDVRGLLLDSACAAKPFIQRAERPRATLFQMWKSIIPGRSPPTPAMELDTLRGRFYESIIKPMLHRAEAANGHEAARLLELATLLELRRRRSVAMLADSTPKLEELREYKALMDVIELLTAQQSPKAWPPSRRKR